MPILSLITITHNVPELGKTLESVKIQDIDPKKIEHIIVDNLSTDNAPEVVKKYQQSVKYPVIYIREKDTGRYQGMNKGIRTATGDYLLFLNAGDCLHNSKVLSNVFEKNKYTADILYGDIDGKSLKKYPINRQFFLDRTLFHQATFIKKTLFDNYGLYDENLIISGDFDFFIKTIIKHHATTQYLPLVVTDYDSHGISSQQSDLVYQERSMIITRYYSGKTYFYNLIKYLYYKNKKYFPKFMVKLQQQHLASKPKI